MVADHREFLCQSQVWNTQNMLDISTACLFILFHLMPGLGKALKNWYGRFYVLNGNSLKMMGHPIVNFTKAGGAAALTAPLVLPALLKWNEPD